MRSSTVPPADSRAAHGVARAGVGLLMVLPWVWPFTPGPTPNTVPLLIAWSCVGVAVITRACVGSGAEPWRQLLAPAWLAAAAINALIGLAQWFGVAPDTALVSAAKVAEAYGNLRQRNQFASLMAIGLAVLVFMPPVRLPRLAVFALAALLGSANATSASRTGLLACVVLTVLAAVWPGPRKARLQACAAAWAAYVLAAALLPAVLLAWRGVEAHNAIQRAVSDLGCSSRQVLWANVLVLIAQRPWTGWGIGELDYAHFMTLYPGARFCDILDNAHNLPLHLAVELGVPAALAVLLVVACLAWRAQPWKEGAPQRQLAWAVLVVIGLHSLLEYPLWYGPFQLATLGALLLLWRRNLRLAQLRGGAMAAAAALAACGYAWFVYDTVSQAYKAPEQRRPGMRAGPVAAAGHPLLFRDQLAFAELSVTPLTRANAGHVLLLATAMLHYSPEPMVVEKLLDSAILLGRHDEVERIAARYKAAFPDRWDAWFARTGSRPASPG